MEKENLLFYNEYEEFYEMAKNLLHFRYFVMMHLGRIFHRMDLAILRK